MAPLHIDRTSGSAPDAGGSFSPETTTTVKLDEKDLGQVANRLGIGKHDLLEANPHIKDPSNLVAGQDIHLPQNQGLSTSANDAASQQGQTPAAVIDKAPLTDPITKNVINSSLDAARQAPATPATQPPVAEAKGGLTGLFQELKLKAEIEKIHQDGQDLIDHV